MQTVLSKLPSSGVSIFEVMSVLARQHQAVNLSQGFPDFGCAPELVESVAHYMREGHNQYAPMPGVIPLREALAMKIERLYGHRYDPVTEITVTSGATEALYATLTALVHPGDEVLLFQPAYDLYAPVSALGSEVDRLASGAFEDDDLLVLLDQIRENVNALGRLVVILKRYSVERHSDPAQQA